VSILIALGRSHELKTQRRGALNKCCFDAFIKTLMARKDEITNYFRHSAFLTFRGFGGFSHHRRGDPGRQRGQQVRAWPRRRSRDPRCAEG
jgi:hypothetical protein